MLIIFLVFLFVMSVIQIGMFLSFPKWIRLIFCLNQFIGMIVNFGLSSIIVLFTGVAVYAGISNLFASIIFGIFLHFYTKVIGKITYNLQIPFIRITNENNKLTVDTKSLSFHASIKAENLK